MTERPAFYMMAGRRRPAEAEIPLSSWLVGCLMVI